MSKSENGTLLLFDDEKSTSEYPEHWEVVKLGELADEMCLGKMLDKKKNKGTLQPYLRNVNVRWLSFDLSDLKEMRFEEGEEKRFGLEPGDLVVCEGGEPGRAAVWRGQSANAKIQKALHRIRFAPDAYDPDFAAYYIFYGTSTHRFNRFYTGSTIKHLTGRAFRNVEFPVPPVPEQKRIVSKIEELFSDLDAGVSALERARANLRRYRASFLKSAVEGRLTQKWRSENPDVEPATELLARILRERRQRWEQQQLATYESKGKKLPKNWQSKYKEPAAPNTGQISAGAENGFAADVWLPIDAVIETLEQGWSPKCKRVPSPSDDKWGVIKTSAVMPMKYIQRENKLLPDELEPRPNLEVELNDILLTRAGPRKRAAVACLVRSTRPRLIVCDKVYRIKFNPRFALPEYIEIVLNAPSIGDVMDEMKTGISDSGVNLTQNRFRELMIPLPPVDEQLAIVAEVSRLFSVVENADSCLSNRIKHSSTLRQSILKGAFEGKLVRSCQDIGVVHGHQTQLEMEIT